MKNKTFKRIKPLKSNLHKISYLQKFKQMKTKVIMIIIIVFFTNIIMYSQKNKYLLSKIAYEKADFTKSFEHINNFIVEYPKNEKALSLKIDILFKLNNYTEVKENILLLNKYKNKDYYLLLSRAYAGLSNQKKTLENFKLYMKTRFKKSEAIIKSYKEFDILLKNKDWVNIWKKDMYSNREKLINNAEYAFNIKNYPEAEVYIDKYLLKYKKSEKAYYMKALINFKNKDYKNALKNYEKAINIESNSNKINLAYATCLIELKKTKKAFKTLNKIIETDSSEIDAFFQRAKLALITNNIENAQDDIDYYIQYYPENEGAIFLSAQIDFKAGDFLSAIPKYGKLIKQNPAKEEYFIGRANAYIKTETYRYAINDYSMALDLNPKLSKIYYKKANAHLKLGETKQACTNWNYSYKLGNNQCTKLIYRYCK